MNIWCLDKPTNEFINHAVRNGFKLLTSHLQEFEKQEANIVYTQFTSLDNINLTNIDYILCPCTNIDHLKAPSSIPVIYLDDKEFLAKKVWSTAEHTVFLMLSCLFNVKQELRGKTLGFIGFGRVANQVYQLIKGFSLSRVMYYDPNVLSCLANVDKVSLPLLLSESDIISINCVSNENTRELLGREEFKIIDNEGKKPIIINTARDEIIDWAAMAFSLLNNNISAIGIDVTREETNIALDVLRVMSSIHSHPNIVTTKHSSGCRKTSRVNTDIHVLDKLIHIKDMKELVGGDLHE